MDKKLTNYREKRNFEKTSEPSGNAETKSDRGGLRFAVQLHDATRLHYDFRLEWNGVLLSWAVPKGPSYLPSDKRLAVKVEDHPLEYADFEGAIPEGEYGGGTVMLWDEGTWTPVSDVESGLNEGALKFDLHATRLKGRWALVRMQPKDGEKGDNWLLVKDRDGFAKTSAGISKWNKSVKSGRTMREIADDEKTRNGKNPFETAEIQLAKLSETIPNGDDWLFEIKYDGYRIVSYVEDGKARLLTRNGLDYAQKFRPVKEALETLSDGRAMVFDGEIIVEGADGKPDFSALQQYVKKPAGKKLVYVIFDLLAADGKDLRELPLTERKDKLAALLKNAPPPLSYSEHVRGGGKEIFDAAKRMELEGIVGKRADSAYTGSRNGDWIKIKCYRRQEFVIGGYTRTEKKSEGASALLLGVYDGEKLVFTGRAGTGIGSLSSESLKTAFRKYAAERSPFTNEPDVKKEESVFYLQPKLVAEVQFAERTSDGRLRQASFHGLRPDKDAKDVVWESSENTLKAPKTSAAKSPRAKEGSAIVCGVAISNPGKIVFETPKMTKLEVAKYYEAVAPRMMNYIEDRLLSVVRCHGGVTADCYYKKHPDKADAEGIEIVPVENKDGDESNYFSIGEVEGLIEEAQSGTIEFHAWASRTETLDQPDMMVFDLDPDENMPLDQVRQGVRDLKSVLDSLKLSSFLKTSGGKGYHVVVPFDPEPNFEEFQAFSRKVVEFMVEQWPERYTANVRKIKRKGKIFIDWGRNGRGATSVAPYSLRARAGAKVSMPISFQELDKIEPNGIDAAEAVKRLKRVDPWKDFEAAKNRFEPKLPK